MSATNSNNTLRWCSASTVECPNPVGRRTTKARHNQEDWEPYRTLILDLYDKQNKKLEDVISIVRDTTGFEASPSQYKHVLDKWDVSKQLKLSRAQRLDARRQRDERASKGIKKHKYTDSRTGKVFNSKSVEKALRRHEEKDKLHKYKLSTTLPGSVEMVVSTPSPEPETEPLPGCMPVIPLTEPVNVLEGDLMELDEFEDQSQDIGNNFQPPNLMQFTAPAADPRPPSPNKMGSYLANVGESSSSAESRVHISATGIEEPDSIYTGTQFMKDSVQVSRADDIFDNDDIVEVFRPLPDSTPGTPFSISEFFEFFEFDACESPSGGIVLKIDLPYFILQDILANHCLSGAMARVNSPELKENEVLGALQGLTRVLVGHQTRDLMPIRHDSIIKQLSQTVPERGHGQLESHLQQLFKPSHHNLNPLWILFGIVAFHISNNFIRGSQIRKILIWIVDQKYVSQFSEFLNLESAEIRSLKGKLIPHVIAMESIELLQCLSLSGEDGWDFIHEVIWLEGRDFMRILLDQLDDDLLFGDFGDELFGAVARLGRAEMARGLLARGLDPNSRSTIGRFDFNHDGKAFTTPLGQAVLGDRIDTADFLLKNGADVDASVSGLRWARTDEELPLLCVACKLGLDDILNLLLEHGATISGKSEEYFRNYGARHNPELYEFFIRTEKRDKAPPSSSTIGEVVAAARRGNESLSSLLMDTGMNVPHYRLDKALRKCILDGDVAATATLLKYGVSANGTTLSKAPLQVVAYALSENELMPERMLAITRLLIDAGANVNIPGLLDTPMDTDRSTNTEITLRYLDLLIESGADLSAHGPEALVLATVQDRIEIVALLLDNGCPINQYNAIPTRNLSKKFFTPLQAAAYMGNTKLAEYLLKRGADVNYPAYPSVGCTALQAACQSGKVVLMRLLLDGGADVIGKAAVDRGFTVLEAIFSNDPYYTVKIFKLTASEKGKLCAILLQYGADPTVSSGGPTSLVHELVRHDLRDILDVVLKKGADPHKMFPRGEEGRTPLQLAAEFGHLEIAKLLVSHGAKINQPPANAFGRTALQAAALPREGMPSLDMIRYLIDNGADVDAPAGVSGGLTSIQAAAISGCIPAAKLLLDSGADVNSPAAYRYGRTALEGAAEHGRLDMVQWLINHGAVGSLIPGEEYKKAIELAESQHCKEVIKILRSAQFNKELSNQAAELFAVA